MRHSEDTILARIEAKLAEMDLSLLQPLHVPASILMYASRA